MSVARQCCLCKGTDLSPLFRLADLSISHYLRKEPDDPDPRFSIGFECCRDCGLLQIVDAIPADLIYSAADTYTTGFQKPRHLDDLITTAIARQDPGRAIDIGCNDGALMEALLRAGYEDVVGVEPNSVAATAAREKGHKVYCAFLTEALAATIVAECGEFDTVYLRHVVEHVCNLDEFFAAIRMLVRENGLLVVEMPDVEEAMTLGSPAILWEEHVSYFTAAHAEYMLERFGFRVLDRRRYAFGGGSIAFVTQMTAVPPPCSVTRPDPGPALEMVHGFAAGLERQKSEMRDLVELAQSRGYRVAVYGAAPRSCLVLSACQIGEMIDLVVDDRPDIHHRFMPGTRQLIRTLPEAAGLAGDRLLCLLGVGSENEFKVRAKVTAAIGESVAFVSLFPPRDAMSSVAAARRAIAAGLQ